MLILPIKRNWLEKIRAAGEKGIPFKDIVLRAGYSLLSPAVMIHGRITVGTGRPEWGALPGEEYYILHIKKMEDLITDNKSYQQEGKNEDTQRSYRRTER